MNRHAIEPRMLTTGDALYYAGFSSAVFSKMRKILEAETGFPKPHPITKKYDRWQLDEWLNKTGWVNSHKRTEEQEMLDLIKNGKC